MNLSQMHNYYYFFLFRNLVYRRYFSYHLFIFCLNDTSPDFIYLILDLMKPLETVLLQNCEILLPKRCNNSKSSQDHLSHHCKNFI